MNIQNLYFQFTYITKFALIGLEIPFGHVGSWLSFGLRLGAFFDPNGKSYL
jgi:hypothetical protein